MVVLPLPASATLGKYSFRANEVSVEYDIYSPVQCCNSVQSSGSGGLVSLLLGLLGVVLNGVNVPIGLTCSPLSIIGIGSGAVW